MESAPRQGIGQFFRALCDYLDERGLREQVRSQLSAPAQDLMDKPPRALAFLPSHSIDELEAALMRLAGADACVEAGLAVARPLGWTLLQPVMRLVFQLFGQSPEPVFANLDRFRPPPDGWGSRNADARWYYDMPSYAWTRRQASVLRSAKLLW